MARASRDLARQAFLLAGEEPDEVVRHLEKLGISCRAVDQDRLTDLFDDGDDERTPSPVLVLLADPSDLTPLREVRAALPRHPVLALTPEEAEIPSREALHEVGCDGVVRMDDSSTDTATARLAVATERRRLLARMEDAETRLEASEARFRNTVQRVADGILILDDDGRILFASEAAGALFGRDAEALRGEEFGFPVAVGETTEVDLVGRDGRRTVAELRVTRTEWEGRDSMLVSLRDVTRQREAEERKRELIREQAARREAEAAAERGAFLADASRELYASLDFGEVLRALATRAAERFCDVCVVETRLPDIQIPRHRVVAAREGFEDGSLTEALRDPEGLLLDGPAARGVVDRGEPRLLHPDDPEWPDGVVSSSDVASRVAEPGLVALLLHPLFVGREAVGVLALMSFAGDATTPRERALIDELGRRAGLALENARLYRLASRASDAKSDFLNVVSHELRTPLTGIVGYVGLMKEGLAGPMNEAQEDYLEGIERNSEQLLHIIEQILLFADSEKERQEVRRKTASVRAIVEEVLTVVRPLATEKGLELRTELPERDVRVPMDAEKVRQILLSLSSNAVKFTPSGWVELAAELGPDRMSLRVSDSGIGVPGDEQEAIFRAFYQVESPETRVAGGTGIGLSVVENLTRVLGGSIDLKSDAGRGSTFTVELPLDPPPGTGRRGPEGRRSEGAAPRTAGLPREVEGAGE